MIIIKEEFVGGEKWRRALKLGGGEAIIMWLALARYAAEHPVNDGFIPDEDIEILAGAPRHPRRALRALVDCGCRGPDGVRGAGLVGSVESGWRLIDDGLEDDFATVMRDKWRSQRAMRRAAWRVRPILPTDVCAYCGTRSDRMTIDHVVPLSLGGDSHPSNLVPACSSCNSRKGGRTPEQAGMVLV